jgi:dCMP deaminase
MPKREGYLEWNAYFMEVAKITAQRSKDPNTQVGTCIVGENNKIIGIGYNGMPRGCSDDEFTWERPEKHLYVCHAEQNALLNSNNFSMINGSTLYTTLFPCNECAKTIIQLGVVKIIYLEDKYSDTEAVIASKKMFDASGVKYEQFKKC